VSLVCYNYFEPFSVDQTGKSGGHVVADNKNRAIVVKIVLRGSDHLDVLFFYEGQPVHDLISPVESKGAGRYDKHRPVLLEEVTDGDGLDGLTHTHLITNKTSPEMVDPKLNSVFLKVIQRCIKIFGELTELRFLF
jgi:hypothetical protein